MRSIVGSGASLGVALVVGSVAAMAIVAGCGDVASRACQPEVKACSSDEECCAPYVCRLGACLAAGGADAAACGAAGAACTRTSDCCTSIGAESGAMPNAVTTATGGTKSSTNSAASRGPRRER